MAFATVAQVAIEPPRARQSAAARLVRKASAAGIEGEQVDGSDVIAVRTAVTEALIYRLADRGKPGPWRGVILRRPFVDSVRPTVRTAANMRLRACLTCRQNGRNRRKWRPV